MQLIRQGQPSAEIITPNWSFGLVSCLNKQRISVLSVLLIFQVHKECSWWEIILLHFLRQGSWTYSIPQRQFMINLLAYWDTIRAHSRTARYGKMLSLPHHWFYLYFTGEVAFVRHLCHFSCDFQDVFVSTSRLAGKQLNPLCPQQTQGSPTGGTLKNVLGRENSGPMT